MNQQAYPKDLWERNITFWVCSDATCEECIKKNLFGDAQQAYYKGANVRDLAVLLNKDSGKVYGIYEIVDGPRNNIDNTAWGGKFQYQAKVRCIGKLLHKNFDDDLKKRLSGVQLIKLGNFCWPRMRCHAPNITCEILEWFEIDEPTEDVRLLKPSGGFDEVAGLEDIKKTVREMVIDPANAPELAAEYDVPCGGGLLLFGPPGTGKTLIAKAIAKEIDAEFIEISPSVIQGFPGEAEQRLEHIFSKALKLPRAVIFLDECEGLLPRRETTVSSVMQRIVPVLLRLFTKVSEATRERRPILVIGATNRPQDIDGAFLRPGRFDEVLYVPLPDKQSREKILEMELKKCKRVDEEVYNKLGDFAMKMDGWSGSDIYRFVTAVKREAFSRAKHHKGEAFITADMLNGTLNTGRFKPSVDENQVRKIEEWAQERGII